LSEQFAALYARHHLDLLRYVLTLVPDRVQAEDVVQEAACVLWRKADQFDPERPFWPWARQVAWFEVLKHRRNHAVRQRYFSAALVETLAEERAAQEDALEARRTALQGCLQRLDEASRQLLIERFGEGRALVDIAARQGRSANALYLMMHRIRQRLVECVERTLRKEGLAG
jgi:RNA polymerase sigma-70 factor, ECF subfamily